VGGEPWFYFVPYQPDVTKVLADLRKREFEAGRYNPAEWFPSFPPDPDAPVLGAKHRSIEEAIKAAGADGTRSILDMHRVGTDSDDIDYGVVTLLSVEFLQERFGTPHPTRAMIEDGMDFMEDIDRGQGVYTVVYRDGQPAEIFFAGYSYD
jgi:hypothetical protein